MDNSVDYGEIFSPTLRSESLNIPIIAMKDLKTKQMDIAQAHLYSTLQDPVFMRIPEGMDLPDGISFINHARKDSMDYLNRVINEIRCFTRSLLKWV